MDAQSHGDSAGRWKPWLFRAVKGLVLLLVLAFVGRRAWDLVRQAPASAWKIDWIWLVPAAGCYLAGWLPATWFWRRMLSGFGPAPAWWPVLTAYYTGHLGKYVPGKAMVLVIRAALLKDAGVRPALAGVTAAYETLATMGAGAAIAVALAPIATSSSLWNAAPAWLQPLRRQTLLMPVLVIVATAVCLPVITRLFTLLTKKMLPRDQVAGSDAVGVSLGTLAQGLAAVSLGWVGFGLSLGFVLRALGATQLSLTEVPVWVAAATLSTVGGFVVLIAPGGLGVRELLLTEVLLTQGGISEVQAFLAAWVLRAVWLLSELAAAGVLPLVHRLSASRLPESPLVEPSAALSEARS